jgi:hypothetical protein
MTLCTSALLAQALSRRLRTAQDPHSEAGESISKLNVALNTHGLSLLKNQLTITVLLLILVSLPIVPVGQGTHLSLAAVLAGVLGEVSSLSVLLVLANLVPHWPRCREWKYLLLPIASALMLYWTVLTYGPVDLYRLGYLHAATGKMGTVLLLAGVAISSLLYPLRLAVLLTLACMSWMLGLQASTNLWDYLLDLPSVVVYLWLLMGTFRRRLAL